MSGVTEKNNLIEIKTQVCFLEQQSDASQNHYMFAYTMTIINSGKLGSKLISRRWVITDANDSARVVEGTGVIGEQPYLKPGEKFEYTSFTIIETPVGSMHGEYKMIADDGTEFLVPIPPFSLAIPSVVN